MKDNTVIDFKSPDDALTELLRTRKAIDY